MKLMQQLLADACIPEETLEEGYFNADYAKFKKQFKMLDGHAVAMNEMLGDGSFFSKRVDALGGDAKLVKLVCQHLEKLMDELQELEMSVGIAQEHDND